MKKLLSMVMGLALVVGLAGMAYADDMVKGKVVSVDSASKTLLIDTANGQKTIMLQDSSKGVKGLKPGMNVEVTCFDVDGKSCVKKVKVISGKEAVKHIKPVEGEVVSIDQGGKTIVIKTAKGKKMTLPLKESPVVEKVTVQKNAADSGKVTVEPTSLAEIKPGTMVRMDCIDSEGAACVSRVSVVPQEETKSMEVVGKVVSIDPAGKTIVVKTSSGKKTLYYQETSTGAPLDTLAVGKKVKAFCLDVDGKSCIKDITESK